MNEFTTEFSRRLRVGVVISAATLSLVMVASGKPLPILRTARQDTNKPAATAATQEPTPGCPEADQLRKNVQQLTADVQRLKKKVADLERDLQIYSVQDLLTREEQRGEGLQLHLIEIAEKEEPLQGRFDLVNQQLRPDNVDRALAGVGSVHPEDTREDLRKRLVNERFRLQAQLELLRQDKMRTQASLVTTDAAIARLRQKLAELVKPY